MEKDTFITYRRRRLCTTTKNPLGTSKPNSSTKVTQQSEICTGENSVAILEERSNSDNRRPKTDTLWSNLGAQEKKSSTIKVYTRRSKQKTKKVYDTPSTTVQGQGDVQSTSLVPASNLGKTQSQASTDMLACPAASCESEFQPLDFGSLELNLDGASDVQHSLGSARENNMPMLRTKDAVRSSQVSAANKKRKQRAGSTAALSSTSLNTNNSQFFEERSNDVTPRSSNSLNLVAHSVPGARSNQLNQESMQSPHQVLYEYAPHSPFQSSSHDVMSTRDGSARTNRNNIPEFGANLWYEDELDSLWIGVRRHGLGNWDNILRDRRLKFMPWRRAHQLAQRWEAEQSNLHVRNPVCQNPLANVSSLGPVVVPSPGCLRIQWPNEFVGEAAGTTTQQQVQLSLNTAGSFSSLLRQVEQNALQAATVNTQLLIGRANTDKGV